MGKLLPYRKDLPYSYTPGVFPSLSLLSSRPSCARRLLLHSEATETEGIDRLRVRCESLGIRIEPADRILRTVSRKENCYAALVFDKYDCTLSDDTPHIVLHQPSDRGNLGTILRTCLGFGFHDVAIIQPACDVFDPRTVRASMGSLFSLNVRMYDTFDAYRAEHASHALYPFMLTGSIGLQDAIEHIPARYALVFGNEATGLPANFASLGQAVCIAHSDAIDSLNLSIAVAIAAHAFANADKQEAL